MTQSDVQLYPKISSIYNKILQLAIAIVLIVVLMNLILESHGRQSSLIEEHQTRVGDNYIEQAALTTLALLENGKKAQISEHVAQLSVPAFVNTVTLYDETGQTIHQSGERLSMNTLYGINEHTDDRSQELQSFVLELRGDKLYGYLRMTLDKGYWQNDLQTANTNTQELMRIMLIMAGCAGFFLTRGLSRFSRQGYRVATKKAA
ncbi:AhpA/YtjB family protein [Thalassotalea euphylliae]|uniref:AhpA/YtjB family protein n=1 Tax=Thalassotalea euphylliae TaxID=1655234 RepID=UPI00364155EB